MIRRVFVLALLLILVGGGAWYYTHRSLPPERWLGYAEADYVRVAPVLEGRLTAVSVARGDQVKPGTPLFAQDNLDERAARDQASAQLDAEREKLADLQGRGRDQEIEQARADVADSRASYERTTRDLARAETLVRTGAATQQSVDQLRADTASAAAHIRAAEARVSLLTDTSGREHAIAAQRAAVIAAQAALDQAEWRLAQRRVVASVAGLVADTLARPGETMGAGAPVVSLLPPDNILVRFFVPETRLARVKAGDVVGVVCDSCPADLTALVSFVAPQPEYTPPVIYSTDSRGNLVYLIEARPRGGQGHLLKPGQPVEVVPPDLLAGKPAP